MLTSCFELLGTAGKGLALLQPIALSLDAATRCRERAASRSLETPVTLQHQPRALAWLKSLLIRREEPPSARQRALNLVAAVDAGGIPLNPARVNDIARQLGLDVATTAPVERTIERIRRALGDKPVNAQLCEAAALDHRPKP